MPWKGLFKGGRRKPSRRKEGGKEIKKQIGEQGVD
jgi:hypothetical protein